MLASTSRAVSRVLASRASPFVGSMTQARTYHDNIVEHYENPRNVGSLDKNDISVGTVRVFVSSCCGICEHLLLYFCSATNLCSFGCQAFFQEFSMVFFTLGDGA
jgi:hypothetical protein